MIPTQLLSRGEVIFILATLVVSLLLSTAFPLLTYSAGLAVFGLAHVACELRYVDQRFSQRMSKSFAITLGILLFLIVCMRASMVFHLVPPSIAYNVELALVFLLALSAHVYMPQESMTARITVFLFVASLGIGFLVSPLATVLVLAVLHNLTPMGFIVEVIRPSWKMRAFAICLVCFILLPLVIASGALLPLTDLLVTRQENFSIFPTGPLSKHLGVFLPQSLREMNWSLNGFCGIVFAQCMHYLAVIFVMPRLNRRAMNKIHDRGFIPWPKTYLFWALIIGSTWALVAIYLRDFVWARSLYGIAAALHAYVEIPILLWAFSLTRKVASDVVPIGARQQSP